MRHPERAWARAEPAALLDGWRPSRRVVGDLDVAALARHGLVLLALTIPLQRATVIGQLGSLASLTAAAVVPVALWAGWADGRRRALTSTPLVYGVALAWWAGASFFWSVDPDATWVDFVRLLSVVVTAVAFLGLAHDEALRRRLLAAYVAGSVVASLLIVQQYLTDPAAQRYSLGPDASINQVAFTLVLALVPAAYLLALALRARERGTRAGHRWSMAAYGSAYSMILIGVLLSGSRSAVGLSALATAAAVALIASAATGLANAAKGIASLLALSVVLMSALSLTDARPLERALDYESAELGEEARADILSRAWELSAERPVVGAGLGTGVRFTEPGWTHVARNPHNTHMQVFLELGAVGAALWALLVATSFGMARSRPPFERRMWLIQLAILFIGIGARGFIVGVPMWFFLGLVAALGPRAPTPPAAHEASPPG